MDFFDVVNARRSNRSFLDKPVPDGMIEACLEAARAAPSGTNSQPWRFLVVRSPERRAALAEAGFNQPCLKQAPVITVLLGDRGVYKKRLRRAKELADIGAVSSDAIAIIEERYQKAKEGKAEHDKSILANCMLAGQHYVLAATAQGMGCCWVMLFDHDKVTEFLGLDKENFPIALLPTGFCQDIPQPRPRYALGEIAWNEQVHTPWSS